MKIRFDARTFGQAKSGNILGDLWVEFPGQDFPEKNWSDFASVILNWWLIEWERFSEPKGKVATFRFMEGPYQIDIVKKGENLAEVSLIERGIGKAILRGKNVVPITVIAGQLKEVLQDFLIQTESSGLKNQDIEEIRRRSNAIR